MPVTVSVGAVFSRVMTPLDVLVALKLLTEWPKSRTVPPAEVVVRLAPLIAPLSVRVPVACSVTAPVVPMPETLTPLAS